MNPHLSRLINFGRSVQVTQTSRHGFLSARHHATPKVAFRSRATTWASVFIWGLFGLAAWTTQASAQVGTMPVGVSVRIAVNGQAHAITPVGSLGLSGVTVLPGGDFTDGVIDMSAVGDGEIKNLNAGMKIARMEPDKRYEFTVDGSLVNNIRLSFTPPPGYQIEINGAVQPNLTLTANAAGSWNVYTKVAVRVLSSGATAGGRAGTASSLTNGRVRWQVALGGLLNGGSAGSLALIDAATGSSWNTLFTPAGLQYESPSPEIYVYRASGAIRQVRAPEAFVDVVTISPTCYEIKFYRPPDDLGGAYPYAFNDPTVFPYASYRIEQVGSGTKLKITSTTRDLAGQTTARTAETTLERTGGGVTSYAWDMRDWTTSTSSQLVQDYRTWGVTTGDRTESASVLVPASGTNATEGSRTFHSYNWGEEVATQTSGTTEAVTTTYDYYTDSTKPGSYGFIKSASMNDGTWIAYEYDDASSDSTKIGSIHRVYRPSDISPTSVTAFDSALGEVTTYTYANDAYGSPTRPTLVETQVGGTTVAKTGTSYSEADSLNGMTVVRASQTNYYASGSGLTTISSYYREDTVDAFYRNLPTSVQRANGTKQSFVYQRGTLSGTTFSKSGSGGVLAGPASRIVIITGIPGTGYTAYDGYQIDGVDLVDGKSTAEITLRDSLAHVVRTESCVWRSSDSTWIPLSSVDYTYDAAGLLTGRVASNGSTYSAQYVGEQKASETNESGVKLSYAYDAASRVLDVTKEAATGGTNLVTRYGYDASSRMTSETVGYGQTETMVTAWGYDLAGRPTSVTSPGLGTTRIIYSLSSHTRTTTAPDNGTTVETFQSDGRLASITGSAVVSKNYSYSLDNGALLTRCDHGSTSRYEKVWTDWLGRTVQTERPGWTGQPVFVEKYSFDATTGLLVKFERRDGGGNRLYADTLYEYDSLAQLKRSGLDIGNSVGLVDVSLDRIVDTARYFENYANAWWLHEETTTYPTNSSNATHTAALTRTRLTGFDSGVLAETRTTTTNGAVITQTVSVNVGTKTVIRTTSQAGINDRTETTVNGLPTGTTDSDGLSHTTGYDSLGRPNTTVDLRTGTTTVVYKNGTRFPYTVTDATGLLATYGYDTSGRKISESNALGKTARFEYNPRGQLLRQWGDAASPVAHGYDSTYGDHVTQSTYRGGTGWGGNTWPGTPGNAGSPGTADTVTWNYHAGTGLLNSKTDALGRAVNFDYNARGQTFHRIADRGLSSTVKSTYSYDGDTGELHSVGYDDGTPSVTYYYDRQGHTNQVDDVTGTRVFDLCACGRVNSEALPSAFYGARVLTLQYEGSGGLVGRYKGFQLGDAASSGSDLEQDYTFTSGGRFDALLTKRGGTTTGSRTFQYGYLADSSLVNALTITGGHPFTVARGYNAQRDLLEKVDSMWSGVSQTRFDYTHTAAMQRQTAKQSGLAFADYWTDQTNASANQNYSSVYQVYAYNDRGEVQTAAMYRGNAAGTVSSSPSSTDALPGHRFEYRYDSIGNRTTAGSTGATNTADDEYVTNGLNQYSSKENNTVRVLGTASGASTVKVAVDGAPSTGKVDRVWGADLIPANSSPNTGVKGTATAYAAIVGGGSGGADLVYSTTSNYFVPAAFQSFVYDYAGNLTRDGVWVYTYDAENRLVSMETDSALIGTNPGMLANAEARRLEFKYDYLGRRVQKIVRGGRDSTTGIYSITPITNRKYLYDDWNLIAEFDALSTLTLVRSYTWGLDLAGSLSATGGVGALLQIHDHVAGKTYLPTYDGNGNVVSLLDATATSASIVATYEHGPFGEPLRSEVNAAALAADGALADQPFRFSTKFTDIETGLTYYGHRYYSATLGRFINRDPIEEQGGLNLYGFVGNDSVNGFDWLGLTMPGLEKYNADGGGGGGGGDPFYGEIVVLDAITSYTSKGPQLDVITYLNLFVFGGRGQAFSGLGGPLPTSLGKRSRIPDKKPQDPNKSPCAGLANDLAIALRVQSDANRRIGSLQRGTPGDPFDAVDGVSGVSATVAAGLETANALYGGLDSDKFWYNDAGRSFTRSGGGAFLSNGLTAAGIVFDATMLTKATLEGDRGGMLSSGASLATPAIASALRGPMMSLALTGSNAGMLQAARFGGPMVSLTVGIGQVIITDQTVRTQRVIDQMEETGVAASVAENRYLSALSVKRISDIKQQQKANGCQ